MGAELHKRPELSCETHVTTVGQGVADTGGRHWILRLDWLARGVSLATFRLKLGSASIAPRLRSTGGHPWSTARQHHFHIFRIGILGRSRPRPPLPGGPVFSKRGLRYRRGPKRRL
jgi:hypothetical protein